MSPSEHQQADPHSTRRDPRLIGLSLFLGSLTMLFLAAIGGYVIIRYSGRYAPASGSLRVPWILLVSTGLMIGSSLVLHLALLAIRAGRERAFVTRISLAAVLSVGFVAVQAPALYGLLADHWAAAAQKVFLYGMMVMLIGLHALHVVGGLVPLLMVAARARRGRYSPQDHNAVRLTTVYWHFLDAVWLVMLAVLYLTA